MKNAWIMSIVLLIVSGCATTKPVQQPIASVPIESIIEDITTQSNVPKEIKGSGENRRVLHKDYYFQNAKPGDWQMTLNGKPLTRPRYLTQGDIDYSLKALDSLNEELLDESPGSVRAMLDDLFDDGLELPGEPTEPDEVDYNLIHGRVVEYINDIRGGRQTILIVTDLQNKAFFDTMYKAPPYLKEITDVPPDQIAFTLMKKVNSNANRIFSLNEDIQSTKKLMRTVKEAKEYVPPPPPVKQTSKHKHESFDMLLGLGMGFDSVGLLVSNKDVDTGRQFDINAGVNYDFYVFPWLSASTGLMFGLSEAGGEESSYGGDYRDGGLYMTIPLSVHFNIPYVEWLYVGVGVGFNIPIVAAEHARYYTSLPIDIGFDFAKTRKRAGRRLIFKIIPNFHAFDGFDYYVSDHGDSIKMHNSTIIYKTFTTYGLVWQFYNGKIFSKK
ncbi:hypothetical protein AGMMS49940_21230 [Spirochaetia bacterium]|nr:hypothetical protein AGMMS49940_21230 [Spirochaetia bacterium]